MRRHLDAGYTMVKMKVGGAPLAEDVARLEAVKQVLPAGAQLAVDANRKFDRDDALAYAKALAPFGLRWFEEPCDPLDFALLAEIRRSLRAAAGDRREPVLDAGRRESRALRRPAPQRSDVIQIDPPQAYGIVQYGRTVAMLERHGWPRVVPVPARRQPDVARHRRRLRARRRESYPGVFGVFGGFADDAQVENGYITLSDRPGIGFEGHNRLYAVMKELAA